MRVLPRKLRKGQTAPVQVIVDATNLNIAHGLSIRPHRCTATIMRMRFTTFFPESGMRMATIVISVVSPQSVWSRTLLNYFYNS
jgi:hypothetical protein